MASLRSMAIISSMLIAAATACHPVDAPPFPPAATEPPNVPDPCSALRSQLGQAWDGKREALVAACAPRRLHELRPLTAPSAQWKLAASSRLLPLVRLYIRWDRYPNTQVLDFLTGDDFPANEVVTRADEDMFGRLLREHRARAVSAHDADDLARFLLHLELAPHLPADVHTTTITAVHGWDVTVSFRHTVVWSPPGHPEVAGAKTSRTIARVHVESAPGESHSTVRTIGWESRVESTWPQ